MGLAKHMYTLKNEGRDINYDPQPKNTLLTGEYKIVKIPDGILNVNEIEVPKKTKKTNVKKQLDTIKQLEKIIKKQQQSPKILIKTASIKDVASALGKKYTIERDKNYKCRRWVVSSGTKEWYIRYNDPLCCAVAYIQEHGAAKFLKVYTMDSKYN